MQEIRTESEGDEEGEGEGEWERGGMGEGEWERGHMCLSTHGHARSSKASDKHYGTCKSFNLEGGFGFIECEQTFAKCPRSILCYNMIYYTILYYNILYVTTTITIISSISSVIGSISVGMPAFSPRSEIPSWREHASIASLYYIILCYIIV